MLNPYLKYTKSGQYYKISKAALEKKAVPFELYYASENLLGIYIFLKKVVS